MKPIVYFFIVTVFAFCALQTKAQEMTIRSKHGLVIYPAVRNVNPITIYPNPATSLASVKSLKPLSGFNMEVFDEAGISRIKQEYWSGEALNVSQLQAGVYILRFTKGKERYSQKLVVVR